MPKCVLYVALIAVGCSQSATSPPSQTRVAAAVTDEKDSLRAKPSQRDEELTDLSRGTTLLLTLTREPKRYRALFEFLSTIDERELRCTIIELTDYPLVLYSFHRSYVLPDGSHRPVFDRKSALVLVDAKTLRAIDFATGTGYRTEGHASGEPWTTEWEQSDGTQVRYTILTSGFERMGDDDRAESKDSEPSHAPEPAAGSVSNGEPSPPAR